MEIILILVAIILLIFWLWMLIDGLKRPNNQFKTSGNYAKPIWVLLITFIGLVGVLI